MACAPSEDRSACASAQSDQSSLCARWVANDPSFLHADSEDSDQTGRIRRLFWVFAGRTCHFLGFVVRWLKCFICLCVCGFTAFVLSLFVPHFCSSWPSPLLLVPRGWVEGGGELCCVIVASSGYLHLNFWHCIQIVSKQIWMSCQFLFSMKDKQNTLLRFIG